MITFYNSRTVYLGTDMNRFNEIRDWLEANGIKYKYKVKNRLSQWHGHGTLRGNLGSAGSRTELMYEYEILVHRNDFERVRI